MPGKHRRGHRKSGDHSDLDMDSDDQEIGVSFSPDSPVLAAFRGAAEKLNKRYEIKERLVKLSRKIRSECKKITILFFSPISTDTSENTVTEAQELIQQLINGPMKSIGLELEHCHKGFYANALTVDFQEYCLARIMLSFMKEKRIITYPEVQKELEYNINENDNQRLMVTVIPHSDYMLSLADLTGGLMKKAIDGISNGDTEECYKTTTVLRHLYTGFLSLKGKHDLLDKKLPETQINVLVAEDALRLLHMRGQSQSPHLLLRGEPAQRADAGQPLDRPNYEEGYNY